MSVGRHASVFSIPEFVAKWEDIRLSERATAQSHFIDLCIVLDQDTPTDADAQGTAFTFEKGAAKNSGEDGFADVWKRRYFAWEYKRPEGNLQRAYQQLLTYREALENPPLLVVCDLHHFEVHTNWTNTPSEVYSFSLQDLRRNQPTGTCKVAPIEVLRSLFMDPERLKPGRTSAEVTSEAAKEFGKIAESLRSRGISADRTARFIMRLVFCLFAEDVGLLRNGLFTQLIDANRKHPQRFTTKLQQLFGAMASEGGSFGADDIRYFDGGLFLDDEVHDLTESDLKVLLRAASLNWAGIEPAIFGTLFERILDPDKRSQIGAHYTSKDDILMIVDPVLIEPLRRKWAAIRNEATGLIEQAKGPSRRKRARKLLSQLLGSFAAEIASITVFDPACGSGNFLYVALKLLLDLEKEVSIFAASNGLSRFFVRCRPTQLYGMEINPYAHEIASVAVWIGFLQWQRDNGVIITDNPVMQPLESISCADAVMHYRADGTPVKPAWPKVDAIIGNPPFLGDKKMRAQLGDKYVDDLRHLYAGELPGQSDLVCYWFERARAAVQNNGVRRVGMLATQGIRGGANRRVLERIKNTGNIFWAYADRPWILEGANVHVSMIAFDDGTERKLMLDGRSVQCINADLSASTADLTTAALLMENSGLAFIGTQKGGKFDLDEKLAKSMLNAQGNPNGRPNTDVIKPWANAADITGRRRGMWVIDFGTSMDAKKAAEYEEPFEYLKVHVLPIRRRLRREGHREKWWIHAESRPGMRDALQGKTRYIATPRHSKHRLFVWLDNDVVPDSALVVIARDDDYFFGVLHSRPHELWARRKGTQVREAESGCRYTPSSTFETFPFPWPPGREPKDDDQMKQVAAAAKNLAIKRERLLEAGNRTLTQLYNAKPSWLTEAHQQLDDAVLACYGWPRDLSDEEILARLLELNHERAQHSRMQLTTAAEASDDREAIPKKTPSPVPGNKERRRSS